MHLVAAMDRVPDVRGVLTLFEGVASAAADGYARMAEIPAATLLHLGPGFGNAFANVHNAYKGGRRWSTWSAITRSRTSRSARRWLRTSRGSCGPPRTGSRTAPDARSAATLTAEAVAAARGGGVATLILPADAGWDESLGPAPARPVPAPPPVHRGGGRGRRARVAVRPRRAAARRPDDARAGLRAAARIAAATGAEVFHDTFTPRLERGGGRPRARLLPYIIELALEALSGLDHLVVVGSRPPVGFFAYPGLPSRLADPDDADHRAGGAGGGFAWPRWRRWRRRSAAPRRRSLRWSASRCRRPARSTCRRCRP